MSHPGTVCLKARGKSVLKVARGMLCHTPMSSFESTEEKMSLPVELNNGESEKANPPADADRHISVTLAHELNNILTVVQGQADHLFAKHRENSALAPALKAISDAAHRAAHMVRTAPRFDLTRPTS